ncbi:MAG: aminotransferase class V-fold PLP-dependent enzyme [Albidovulum sp.]|nr:aminotransferase class V-fold PLP-dependent enzyme [Albidovulum sp.]
MISQNPVFVPGPTNMPDVIRKACDQPTVDHRADVFTEILLPAIEGMKKVLKTEKARVFVFPASGSGGWEAAVANTLSPGDTVLAVSGGYFAVRWIDLCRLFGLNVKVVNSEWKRPIPVDEIARELESDRKGEIKAVLATHSETSTGVLNDILAVRRAIDGAGHGAMLFVDGVSSIASMDFRMDEWKVDVAVCGSQKGLMLPAGLSIVGVSEKAFDLASSAGLPKFYFDFSAMSRSYEAGSYPYTPSAALINGLLASTKYLLDEGLENVFARHHRIAEGIRRAVEAWNLEIFAEDPSRRSNAVTGITVPNGYDSGKLVRHAAEKYEVAFGVGLGEVAGKIFRIGHLGSLTDVMAISGIAAAEMAMVDLGYPVSLGSGVSAAQEYFRVAGPAEQKLAA